MIASALSVQLYTLREDLARDLPGTLARLAGLGITRVEPFRLTEYAEALGPALAATGLTAPTAHQHFLGTGRDDEVFSAAAALGVRTVIDPRVDPARWSSTAEVEAIADELTAAAEAAAAHGVRIGYHNHAEEMGPMNGTTALEVLAARLDPAVVLEVDTYWAAVGGQDPVALLRRLGERVAAIHLKDGPATPDVRDQVAVGSGGLPIPAILDAAPHALRVVELDDTRGDRFQAIADSVAWLRGQGLA